MRIEGVDYMGLVDCVLIDDNWGDNGSIFESKSETIYAHPDWNCTVVARNT